MDGSLGMWGEGQLLAEKARVEAALTAVIAEFHANDRPEIAALYEAEMAFLREIRMSILLELQKIRGP